MIELKNLSKVFNKSLEARWIVKDGYNYISNHHWIFKTNQNITGTALTCLVKSFDKIPKEDSGLVSSYKEHRTLTNQNISQTINLLDFKSLVSLEKTNLITVLDNKDLCIFYNSKINEYVYINRKYLKLVNFNLVKEWGISNGSSAVCFKSEKESLIIFRIKTCERNLFLI